MVDPVDFNELPRCYVDIAMQVAFAVRARVNIHLVGPPGVGKTMIARRIPTIAPPLDDHQRRWLEAEYTRYQSISGWTGIDRPPFRAPHHTASKMAMIGDHRIAGELHLARFGVLMLDELPDFSLIALRAVGQRCRAMHGAPILVTTAMPCPCGNAPTAWGCRCTDEAKERHTARVRLALKTLRCAFVEVQVPAGAPLTNLGGRCPSSSELRALKPEWDPSVPISYRPH